MHLVVHKLFKRIAKQQILQGISLEVGSGQLAVILGPRHSGKTELLKVLAGISKPDSGSVFLQDENITESKVSQREVGMIFDQPKFFEHLNIYQNLRLVLKKPDDSSMTDEDIIRSKTEELEFSHLLMSLPSDLTPMQLFTAQLARALLNDPSLLLVDDPFDQVDGSHFNEVRLLLKKQTSRHNRTLVVTTKLADQAQLLANKLAVIDRGTINQIDRPDRIYQKPASLHVANTVYTQGFNIIPARIKKRFKKFIDCELCERAQVRVSVKEENLIEYDRNRVYVCLTPNDFFLVQNEEETLDIIQARLIAVEKTEVRICSHWYVDQDTMLEVHTDTPPKVTIGAITNLFFNGRESFVYSEQGILLSGGRS